MADKKTASWLLQTVGTYKSYILLLVLLQAIVNGGAICYALIMKQMVDSAVVQNQTDFVNGLITFALLMLSLMCIRIVLRQIEESARSGMENCFKEKLFQQLLSKDYAQVNRIHSEVLLITLLIIRQVGVVIITERYGFLKKERQFL